MRTFSVRFYKRLILFFLLLLIIIPVIFAFWFGFRVEALKRQLAEMGDAPGATQSADPSNPSYTPGVVPTGYDLTQYPFFPHEDGVVVYGDINGVAGWTQTVITPKAEKP